MFKKIFEWVAIAFTVAVMIFLFWLMGTEDSIYILASHIGDWGAVVLVVAALAFWFFIPPHDDDYM